MKNVSARRVVAGISLGALAGLGLVSVPSAAHAKVEEPQIGGQYSIYSYNCEGEGEGDWNDQDIASWADDNVPVSKSTSASGTFTAGEGDSVAAKTSTNASITASPLGSGPATITGTATATASALPSGAETECEVTTQALAMATGVFTLTQPTWITVSATGQGQHQGQSVGTSIVGIGSVDSFFGSWEGLFGGFGGDGLSVSAGDRGTATSSTLLPAGDYGVLFGSLAFAGTDSDLPVRKVPGLQPAATDAVGGSATSTGSFKIEFSKPGTATPATGKGASKVQFGERDCATGNIAVNLSKKTVKKAKRVAVRINGAKGPVLKGKKLKGKHPKAKTITVPTSLTGTVKVKVKITLANGRRVQATRSYLPCK
ncbi:hypothetical protein QI633_03020 [Nocardioides sp. QY071]|uniref:hypothetical protein n=1 Tax=Nocardioides sp. QY071 TaxID=3044187 RepID=UPI00249CDEB9|nr:hypothetical protein [Nocardioides sp. QY071]WGY02735.1 hypothetical protein QI633_03020 [Nocardioides sp. QY071]